MKLTRNPMLSAWFRLSVTACMALFFSLSAYAQSIDLRLRNVTVQTAVMELQKKYGYSVAVKSNELDMTRPVSLNVTGKTVQEVVAEIFAGQDIDVIVTGKNIIVAKAKNDAPVRITVKGIVTDAQASRLSEQLCLRKETAAMVS